MGGARSGDNGCTLPNQILPLHGVPICTTSIGLVMGVRQMERCKEGRMTRWNVGLSCMKEIQEMQYGWAKYK